MSETTPSVEWPLTAGRRLSLPPDLTPEAEIGADTRVESWSGAGMRVLVDSGPFADPLTGYEGRPGYRSDEEVIAGRPARLVRFDEADGSRVIAAHIPDSAAKASGHDRFTIVVRSDPSVAGDELALRIIRSLTGEVT